MSFYKSNTARVSLLVQFTGPQSQELEESHHSATKGPRKVTLKGQSRAQPHVVIIITIILGKPENSFKLIS